MVPSKRGLGEMVVVALLVASGCHSSQQPLAAPTSQNIQVNDGFVSFVRWKNGPTIMICSDVVPGTSTGGTGASGPPSIAKAEFRASAADGRHFEWKTETSDGRRFKCWVNGKEYDLSKGGLFLVKTKSGKTEVEQLYQDFSGVQPYDESVRDFARKDPVIRKLLGAEE